MLSWKKKEETKKTITANAVKTFFNRLKIIQDKKRKVNIPKKR